MTKCSTLSHSIVTVIKDDILHWIQLMFCILYVGSCFKFSKCIHILNFWNVSIYNFAKICNDLWMLFGMSAQFLSSLKSLVITISILNFLTTCHQSKHLLWNSQGFLLFINIINYPHHDLHNKLFITSYYHFCSDFLSAQFIFSTTLQIFINFDFFFFLNQNKKKYQVNLYLHLHILWY